MISNNQQSFEKTSNLQMTEFVRLKRESKLQKKDRSVPDKPPPEKRPPPRPQMQMQQTHVTQNNIPKMDMPNLDIPLQRADFNASAIAGVQVGVGKVGISTNLIPLVRIDPRYPMRAQNRGIEGWVKIKFTITKDGTVKDAVIVGSQPAKVFDSAALRTIKRWKYKPKIVDGEAVERRAVQSFDFNISK